ncbi:MAG: homoserine dehydrogenase [Alphaproteobacteria bacterium]|nr:homoserine dehydrogenase [Alphaproteobacteria bacterium]
MEIKLIIIGFGNVGQGLAQILEDKNNFYKDNFNCDFSLVAVCDSLKGSLYDPQGLNISELLQAVKAGRSLESIDAPTKGWDALTTINQSNADIVIELAYTDLKTGEPALSHMKASFRSGKHFVTTNKGPVALHYKTLKSLSEHHGLMAGIEGTVMSGTPSLSLAKESLMAANIQSIEGILNGTTNYMLMRMEAGLDYDASLLEAQEKGYAEADPTGDVDGFDAAAKVVILANVLMGADLTLQDIALTGMNTLSIDDINVAKVKNECWKVLGHVNREPDGSFNAWVKPVKIKASHPLANVSGAMNAITYSTELMGDITLIGAGAGRIETGYAVIEDLIYIAKKCY